MVMGPVLAALQARLSAQTESPRPDVTPVVSGESAEVRAASPPRQARREPSPPPLAASEAGQTSQQHKPVRVRQDDAEEDSDDPDDTLQDPSTAVRAPAEARHRSGARRRRHRRHRASCPTAFSSSDDEQLRAPATEPKRLSGSDMTELFGAAARGGRLSGAGELFGGAVGTWHDGQGQDQQRTKTLAQRGGKSVSRYRSARATPGTRTSIAGTNARSSPRRASATAHEQASA